MTYPVTKSDQQWRDELNDLEYAVLRHAATERPFTGDLLGETRTGTYHCKGCDSVLFDAATKFDAHCGWPSFFDPANNSAVVLKDDLTLGMTRTEVVCAACGSHLGHVFDDAPWTPTGQRYCMNSVSLTFRPDSGATGHVGADAHE
ncbi:peptide-methionine (R)-S-oxide reductase MsrB [Jonesia denitrificans]|uniref:peptide-methionine (R)-S-oxide reductase n=1 Tax=Jonesia denitrificans (strain ATCC 14870 / DSM 20603 / BCRC 15368 / CIP 55.134 / JCM 11481 / NBRC 15587 / NCTC 10816 / Prevot 55134) TaxID=471856 RepID=C7R1P1_JONDD|nr:peptide-methionine (R)-S-oxide reductase MsrB [Jonesia denitrificans]ACV09876.1 methionine-R-sulfoxide reductase [Jonesia denitrificans DSM 20603]ASE10094.1 peptide-methionine (R)-S-oxide reductase [Jonesia denitrificans]QXB43479.1 peptide-methionine (R)-S-oxide reductase MsrB [Jonesia denitrificans]SQH22567.1 Peptide methionine sulfoxide reductase MsrB [Jonesia denitrificans]